MAAASEFQRVLLALRRQEEESWAQAVHEARLNLSAIRHSLAEIDAALPTCPPDQKAGRQWQRVRLLSSLVEAKGELARCEQACQDARRLREQVSDAAVTEPRISPLRQISAPGQ